MNKKITLLNSYGKTRTYLKRSEVLHHPQIYVDLQLISFSVERAFARQKNFAFSYFVGQHTTRTKNHQNFYGISGTFVFSCIFVTFSIAHQFIKKIYNELQKPK